jgi:23S rRNA (adenine2503-C2)-methyltransferase
VAQHDLNLLGMRPLDLAARLEASGVDPALPLARRALAWAVAGARPLAELPRLSAAHRAALAGYHAERPALVERVDDSADGAVRYLFAAADGRRFEAVRIRLERPGDFTVCLSSQVGCAMACAFCATGRLGLGRDLRAAEIVGSWLAVRDDAPGRVRGAVFMGQGEPFANYAEVIRAAEVLSDPNGGRIKQEAITISTVGLVREIDRYTAEGHPFRLIVSLHSAVEARRRALLPVAGRVPLPELARALRDRHARTGQRPILAWVLIAGENGGPDEVDALVRLFAEVPFRLNIIDVNDDGGGERPFERLSDAARDALLDRLRAAGIPFVRRYSVGRESHSACGMLAARAGR